MDCKDYPESIIKLAAFTTIYSLKELTDHFNWLEEIILRHEEALYNAYYKEKDATNLPFALLMGNLHGIALGYDLATKEWILLDANGQPSVRTKNIASLILNEFLRLNGFFDSHPFDISYSNGSCRLLFNKKNKEWYLDKEPKNEIPQEEQYPIFKKFAKTAIQSPFIRRFDKAKATINFTTEVYVSAKDQSLLKSIRRMDRFR